MTVLKYVPKISLLYFLTINNHAVRRLDKECFALLMLTKSFIRTGLAINISDVILRSYPISTYNFSKS